ncbi:Transposable element P transposase [Oopsacas minuta]|uniref:Transposable element P transposase n=1 Tax=Oopsacas minuta TaxID=111878 RepID=A0AAV7JID4_9METZ|nr:Transposable element P transposase [Oopsacas minuta]
MEKICHRDDAWQLTIVFICAKHFNEKDLLLTIEIPQGDGSIKKVPRKPGLCKDSKPSILPNCPSYLKGQHEPPERLDRDEIDIRHFHHALELSIAEHQTENERYSVISIDVVLQKHSMLRLQDEWLSIRSNQFSLYIFKISYLDTNSSCPTKLY